MNERVAAKHLSLLRCHRVINGVASQSREVLSAPRTPGRPRLYRNIFDRLQKKVQEQMFYVRHPVFFFRRFSSCLIGGPSQCLQKWSRINFIGIVSILVEKFNKNPQNYTDDTVMATSRYRYDKYVTVPKNCSELRMTRC